MKLAYVRNPTPPSRCTYVSITRNRDGNYVALIAYDTCDPYAYPQAVESEVYTIPPDRLATVLAVLKSVAPPLPPYNE